MSARITSDLRQGFREVAGALPPDALALIACARDRQNLSPAQRDQVLGCIVAAYRGGDQPIWGPVLLDLLAPALLERLRRLSPQPPTFDEDDLRQQMVLELLHAADTVPLPERYVKATLVSRASKRVSRWLQRERRHQLSQESIDPYWEVGS
jgi:hypothetical protein